MSCDLKKTSSDYVNDLKNSIDLNQLNQCIQKTIDERLNSLVKKEESVSYRTNESQDYLTMSSMNESTLDIYTYNFYFVIFKLLLFGVLIGSYFLLSNNIYVEKSNYIMCIMGNYSIIFIKYNHRL